MLSKILSRLKNSFNHSEAYSSFSKQEIVAMQRNLQNQISQIISGPTIELNAQDRQNMKSHNITVSKINRAFPDWLVANVTTTHTEEYTSALWKDIESKLTVSVSQLLLQVSHTINQSIPTIQIVDQSNPIGSYRAMRAKQYFYDWKGAVKNGYDPKDLLVEYFEPNGNYRLVYSSKPPVETDMILGA